MSAPLSEREFHFYQVASKVEPALLHYESYKRNWFTSVEYYGGCQGLGMGSKDCEGTVDNRLGFCFHHHKESSCFAISHVL